MKTLRSIQQALRAGTIAGLVLIVHAVSAQLTVSPQTNLQQLAGAITGPGVQIANPVISCHSEGFGEFAYSGSLLGLDEGVLLTSGRITSAIGPNNVENKTFEQGTSGNSILNVVTGRTTRDACRFEFDIIPSGDSLRFNFVFASEEYNEWVGSQYNDVFGFFISGPGITGDPGIGSDHNIALIPGTSQAVTINNVNNGSNQTYYYDNAGGSQIQYDGFTRNLSAFSVVQPCQTYHLKLIVADASDRKFDSGVFIERIESNEVTMTSHTLTGAPEMIEGCNDGWVRFTRSSVTSDPLTLQYYIQGTATNGADYTAIGDVNPAVPKTIVIPANQAFVELPITPLADGIAENTEYMRFLLGNPYCTGAVTDSLLFIIRDSLAAGVTPGPSTICIGGSVQFQATGGQGFAWSPAAGLNSTSIANPIASPTTTTNYSVVISEGTCERTIDRLIRVSDPVLSAVITRPLCAGASNGAVNLTVSGAYAPYDFSWTGPGGFTATTEDLVNITTGTYTLNFSDAGGCVRTQSYNVGTPAPLITSLVPSILPFGQNIACAGGSTGTLNLTINGGTGPYTHAWTGPGGFTSSTQNLSSLSAGAYSVTVTDANGCSSNSSFTLTQSTPIVPSVNGITPVDCSGNNSGSATATATGGMPPYAFSWNTVPTQTSATANGLSAGTHTVTITDGYGCVTTANAQVDGPSTPLSVGITSSSDVLCFGADEGSAEALASGGTAPYTYTWSTTPAQNGAIATSLPQGNHMVTVTDSNGCTASTNVNIGGPSSEMSALAEAVTPVGCFGANDGAATITVSGGSGSFTIAWDTEPPVFGPTVTGLAPGLYTATVTDNNGCITEKSVPVTIEGPPGPLEIAMAPIPITCAGAADGAVDLSISGGLGPYTQIWSDTEGLTTGLEDLVNLGADTYALHVQDALGCVIDTTISFTEPAALGLAGAITTADCQGAATGEVDATLSGGTAPYTITWSGPNGFTASTEDIDQLAAGVYSMQVTDARGCIGSMSFDVTEPGSLQTTAITSAFIGGAAVSCPNAADGTIALDVVGGIAPYSFAWSGPNGFASTDEDLTGLEAGLYEVITTDANGCSVLSSVELTSPAPLGADLTTSSYNGSGVSCTGTSDGTIVLAMNGGAAPYAFSWNGPNGFTSNADSLSGLETGDYAVSITDANGCTSNANVTLIDAPPLNIDLSAAVFSGGGNVSCAGLSDGSVDLQITGGAQPHAFAWTDGLGFTASTEDISGIAAGTYQVTATDANGCIISDQVTLINPQPIGLSAELSSMNGSEVSCDGASDGSIDLSVTGGALPHSFSWSDGATTEDLNSLGAGDYTVMVTDANGCVANAAYTLEAPTAIITDLTISSQPGGTSITCNGGTDGSIEANVTGGIAPFTVAWSGPNGFSANTTSISDLPSGTYTLIVTDANGCTSTTIADITEPAPLNIALASITYNGGFNVPCATDQMGTLDASVYGGTPGYAYSWTGPNSFTSASPNLTALEAGTYDLLVTDSNGCTANASIALTEPAPLEATFQLSDFNGSPVSCAGNDGSIDMTISGGTQAYQISWTGPDGYGSQEEDLSFLPAGDYDLIVSDANGCEFGTTITLSAPQSLQAAFISTPNICPGDANGGLDLQVSGGGAPYTFAWTGPNGFMSNDEDLIAVPSGTYTVQVSDAIGCNSTFTTEVDGPAPINSGTYVSFYGLYNLQCQGDSTGAIELTPAGGTTPFTLTINGPDGYFSTDLMNDHLVAGDYAITITDAAGCTMDTTVTLTEPNTAISAAFTVSVYPSGTNVSCHGASDGWIDATVAGGFGPYTFDWRGPDSLEFSTEDVTGLPAGEYAYELVVIDANQCAFSTQLTLTEPDTSIHVSTLLSQYNGFNVSCPTASDGAIDLTTGGGNGGYTYAWTGPNGYTSTVEDLSGLAPGTYSATITDINGCTFTGIIDLDAPEPIMASLNATAFTSGTNISCNGASDGSIIANITGGAPAYVLSWNGPNGFSSASGTISDLVAGTYCLTMFDANGCTGQQCITLNEPAPLTASTSTTNADCGQPTGAVDLMINGGSSPFGYAWDNGASSEDLSVVAPGTYGVIITDMNGCSTSTSATVNGSPGVQADATLVQNLCYGNAEGSINLNVTSGTAPFSFSWDNGASSEDLSGLMAGEYSVTITDANGCGFSESWNITETSMLVVDPTILLHPNGYNISTYQGSDGSITLDVSGGNGPYVFTWSNGSTADALGGVAAGTYTVTVTDANGCTSSLVIELTEPFDLVMPTGFTPNSDGANDAFVIRGLDAFPGNTFAVLNRWGNVVYDRLNYKNDWMGENTEGEQLPNGTYFAILNVNDGQHVLQGYVDLRR